MNKCIVKANELWRENSIERALSCYQHAISHHYTRTDKNVAHHMIAYLNSLLARRSHQEEAFLGVDLRRPYHDYYVQAGQHLAAIMDSGFRADDYGLPSIEPEQQAAINEAYQFYSQVCVAYVETWQMRLKMAAVHTVNTMLNRVQRLKRA